jgi:HEAT repeat protein
MVASTLLIVLAAGPAGAAKPAEVVAKLVRTLERDRDARARARAAEILGTLAAVQAVPALAAALEDKDSGVRATAAGALLRIGEPANDAMPALHKALLDRDGTTVWNAAGALRNMGVVTTDLMPAYRRLLQSPECGLRVSAALAISEYAPPAELLPIALSCRNDPARDYEVSKGVDTIMSTIAKDKSAVPVIAERLREDRHPGTRQWAARALGDLGRAARSAIPDLEAAVNDDSPLVREAAVDALAKVRPKP